MSTGIDTRTEVKQTTCPKCNKKFLKIYDNGAFHCTSCLMGGMICASGYRHLLNDPVLREKINNDRIYKTIVCPNEVCRAIVSELPCEWCLKKRV